MLPLLPILVLLKTVKFWWKFSGKINILSFYLCSHAAPPCNKGTGAAAPMALAPLVDNEQTSLLVLLVMYIPDISVIVNTVSMLIL